MGKRWGGGEGGGKGGRRQRDWWKSAIWWWFQRNNFVIVYIFSYVCVCMYMYVYVYICMYICTYTYVCIWWESDLKTKTCLPVGADRAEANKKRSLRFNTERSLCCVFQHEKCSSALRAICDRCCLLTSTTMRTERCHYTTIYTYMRT